MNLPVFTLALVALSLTACVTPQIAPDNHEDQLAALQQQIADLESSLLGSVKTACEVNTQEFAKELHQDLRAKLAKAEKAASRAKRKTKIVEKECKEVVAEKIVFGEVERVLFEDEEISLDARVDTGAEKS